MEAQHNFDIKGEQNKKSNQKLYEIARKKGSYMYLDKGCTIFTLTLYATCVDYRREDGDFPVSMTCVTFSNLNALSSC
jgi:hypothetical protein